MNNLQDMLYQYKQQTSVDTLVDSAAQIRSLTLELSSKNAVVEKLKAEVQTAIGSKPMDVRRDEDLGAFLTNVI